MKNIKFSDEYSETDLKEKFNLQTYDKAPMAFVRYVDRYKNTPEGIVMTKSFGEDITEVTTFTIIATYWDWEHQAVQDLDAFKIHGDYQAQLEQRKKRANQETKVVVNTE